MERGCGLRQEDVKEFLGKMLPCLLFVILSLSLACTDAGAAFTVNVVDNAGNPVNGFRWQVEEDNTNQAAPGVRTANSIGLDIHKSYSPFLKKGSSLTSGATISLPANKAYFVSVLPDGGYSLSGAPVAVGQTAVTVKVHKDPIPTAQISVLVYGDHKSINNVIDAGERGLPNFTIQISDMFAQVSVDVFGNPLGTTYDANGNVITRGTGVIKTDAQGQAVIKYLAPGRYGIRAIPPTGSKWVQTSTIEGTPAVDTFVKANEPQKFFAGFGTGFNHAVLGFVNPVTLPWAKTPPAGTGSITGRNTFTHFSRPPVNQVSLPVPPLGSAGWG